MKHFIANISIAAAAIFALAGCGTSAPTKMVTARVYTKNGLITYLHPQGRPQVIEKIIGANDLTPVLQDGANIPEKYRPLIDAFGIMSMGCTATHIGKGIVLTAGHCLNAPEARTDNAACDSVTVKWGLRKDKPAYLTSNCIKVLAYELNDNKDYAIFTVDQIPPTSVDVNITERPIVDTPLTIFGFPQMRPLEWSKTCTLQDASKGSWGLNAFSHQCDTEPGNSGSTVLDDNTLKVIGIHDGGSAPWNYGTYLIDTPLNEFIGTQPQPTPTIVPNPTVTPEPTPTAVPNPTVTPEPTPQTVPATEDDRRFSPLGNSKNYDLATFDGIFNGKKAWTTISFVLQIDTEEQFDIVTVKSANGFSKTLFGITVFSVKNWKLPVTVHFESDSSLQSREVIISKIQYGTLLL